MNWSYKMDAAARHKKYLREIPEALKGLRPDSILIKQ
jgi:hypothetical protein